MKKTVIIFFTIAFSLIISGCSSRTICISPSTTPITGSDRYVKLGYAKGSSHDFWLLFFPFGHYQPSRDARNDAIKSSGGNALIEVVEDYNFVCLLIVSFSRTTVEGTAVKVEAQMADAE